MQRLETKGALAMIKTASSFDYLLIGFTEENKLKNLYADFEGIMSSIKTDEEYTPHVPENSFSLPFKNLKEESTGKYLNTIETLSARASNYQTSREQ